MTSSIELLCIAKGMKMTGQRRVVVRVMSESSDHPDVEEVHRRAVILDDKISIATVYRTVRLLEEVNIIDRHDFGDGRSRYELSSQEELHHDHLINVESGEVIEFTSTEIEEIQKKIAYDLGYHLLDHRLELYGVPLTSYQKSEKK